MSARNRMEGIEIRPATAEDAAEFYPNGAPCTIQAWLITYLGRPAVLAGVTLQETSRAAFMSSRPGALQWVSKRTVWEVAQQVFELLKTVAGDCSLFAGTDGKTETAKAFLTHLGFAHSQNHGGKEIYKWTQVQL